MKFTPGATESDARGTEYIEFQMISIAKHGDTISVWVPNIIHHK